MKLVVIGTGYVGLVSGLGYASLGHSVACVDSDAEKIAKLDMGETPFFEPYLPELLSEMQSTGQIVFTNNLSDVLANADIVMIAVGTPSGPFGEADLSSLYSVADQIGKELKHEVVVAIKSTVPVGTNRSVLERIRSAMSLAGNDDLCPLIRIVSLPEFLREGSAFDDFMNPDRIVIGADDDTASIIIDRLHDGIDAPRLKMSIESAELTKYAANAFLATKISFINEIANVAETTGANIQEIANAIGYDKRIGHRFLQAGIGYGGSCFPKDVSALHQLAGIKGYDFKLLSAVIEVNNRQRERFLKNVKVELGQIKGRRIGIWGLAFKGGTDDIRESAGIEIAQRLFSFGAEVIVYDPLAMKNAKRVLSDQINFAATAIDAGVGADAILVLSDCPEFRDVSFKTLKEQMVEPRIFDGRNFLSDLKLEDKGFQYYGVGICKDRD